MTNQTTRNSGADTSQWPRARSERALQRLRIFWMMLPSTRLLCKTHHMQRVLGYADRKFTLACGCKRGNKL